MFLCGCRAGEAAEDSSTETEDDLRTTPSDWDGTGVAGKGYGMCRYNQQMMAPFQKQGLQVPLNSWSALPPPISPATITHTVKIKLHRKKPDTANQLINSTWKPYFWTGSCIFSCIALGIIYYTKYAAGGCGLEEMTLWAKLGLITPSGQRFPTTTLHWHFFQCFQVKPWR